MKISRQSTGITFLILSTCLLVGCAFPKAQSEAERLSGYTYIPLDPFPVLLQPNAAEDARKIAMSDLNDPLRLLPDHAVRNAVETIDLNGNVTFGVGEVKTKIGSYRLTVDYVNSDTISETLYVRKRMIRKSTLEREVVNPFSVDIREYEYGTEDYWVLREDPRVTAPTITENEKFDPEQWYAVTVPLYVGIGIRATANIRDSDSSAKLTGLSSVGIEAELKSLRGTLVLQSIGINGEKIAPLIPVQNELNRTTTQNAIVAIASIKPLITDDTTVAIPRLLGMYLPMPADVQLINAIVSALAEKPIVWSPVVPRNN